MQLKEAKQIFKIYPNTKKALSVWEMAEIVDCPFVVKQAARGIQWALETGRLTAEVDMAVRKMSTYQQLKLLVGVVNNTESMNDVPRWLNERLKAQVATANSYIKFLNDMKDKGMNMAMVRPYLMDKFPELSRTDVMDILAYWNQVYS